MCEYHICNISMFPYTLYNFSYDSQLPLKFMTFKNIIVTYV